MSAQQFQKLVFEFLPRPPPAQPPLYYFTSFLYCMYNRETVFTSNVHMCFADVVVLLDEVIYISMATDDKSTNFNAHLNSAVSLEPSRDEST